jgi:NAD(P)-dependent dehydrogenase (short-subunit alcohol dehydrogenase family)
MGAPEDIAHAVSFPASDQAGFITGQRLPSSTAAAPSAADQCPDDNGGRQPR